MKLTKLLLIHGLGCISISAGSRIFLGGMGVANSESGSANLLFCNYFAKNYEMKEFGPGGTRPWHPLDPPMSMMAINSLFQFRLSS